MESTGSNSDNDSCDSDMWKRRRITRYDGFDYYDANIFLILTIIQPNGIDSLNIDLDNRIYKVLSWVEPGNKYTTPEVGGSLDPEWWQQIRIPFKNPWDCRSLYLEVIRTHSKSDPGTSTGEVLVGRLKIPLPRLSSPIQGTFRLMKLEGPGYKREGSIRLAMELREIDRPFSYFN
ncbi:unnamed protein product [Dovyalis caffra]|uniref:C2 domain-containing protein n=1 Tax=Dovyalis caffra TaxID=77055 RepID=A0AAV1R903_9ROSI|nr:unnamed protein product [Dovyalis caffra]